MTALRPLLSLCALALAACSSDVMLGQACERPGCDVIEAAVDAAGEIHYWPELPEPDEPCSVQLATRRLPVPEGRQLDHCEVFSLAAFSAPQGGVYLTRAELLMTPASHHADIRIAADAGDLPLGEMPCNDIWSADIKWMSLMAARGERDGQVWEAPLAITGQHRVMINHHYINTQTSEADDVGVLLNLHCTREAPDVVSQTFVFEDRSEHTVEPGTELWVESEARFDRAVHVTFLSRRTHLIEQFLVEAVDLAGDRQLIWAEGDANTPWKYTPPNPIELAPGDGFRFGCYYLNAGEDLGDRVLQIGGASSDACALLGIYQLPTGAPDPNPVHVVKR